MLSQIDYDVKETFPAVKGVLVVRNGYVVFENYYQGYGRSDHHHVKSVTKSVISALVGVALKEDRLESVDQRLSEFFPEHFSSGTDPRKRQITVENLLTMTNGFRLNTFDNEGLEDRIMTSDDVVEASIEQPMAKEPGEEFNYNDWGAHLISAILTWEGRQIVPRGYVRTSTREQVEAAPYTEGYGYFWWTREVEGYRAFFAAGYDGQRIYVIPELDLVAVIVTEEPGRVGIASEDTDVLKDYDVVPAVEDE